MAPIAGWEEGVRHQLILAVAATPASEAVEAAL